MTTTKKLEPKEILKSKSALTTAAKLRDEGTSWDDIRKELSTKPKSPGSTQFFNAWKRENIKHRPANEMKPKSASAGITRDLLWKVYKHVLDNWAVGTAEIAKGTELDAKLVTRIAKKLEATGLLAGTHVNDEKAITWQTNFDVQNDDQAAAKGEAAFNEKFPVTQPKKQPAKKATKKPASRARQELRAQRAKNKVTVKKQPPKAKADVAAAEKANVESNLAAAKNPRRQSTKRTQPTESRVSAGA